MMRSLFSGVSGLKVHQTRMDVIGNNIANVNTVGFRASSANFSDVFYQTTQSASGPNAETGQAGTNAMQIGLGVDLASVSVNLSGTGATQRTGRGMDVMINGDAFFVVNQNGTNYFTKSGAFDVDAAGTLYCTTNGATVMGWQTDEKGEIKKDNVSALKLMTPDNMYSEPTATTAVTLSGNIDRKDSQLTYSADGSGYPLAINFYDNLGNSYMAKFDVMKVSGKDDQYNVTLKDVLDANSKSILKKATTDPDTGNVTYATTGQYLSFGGNEVTYEVSSAGVISFTSNPPQVLKFNGTTGKFTSIGDSTAGITNLLLTDGAAGNPFTNKGTNIDFSALSMFASSGSSSIKPTRGDTDGHGAGNAPGSMNGLTVQGDGKIYGVYTNGDQKLLGQIALATFANPSSLEAVGSSLFAVTQNSGDFDGVGVDASSIGGMSVGALEMSNVDLSTEFTNMIVTQRGFQANSRIITTSDTMLEELINLKR